MWGHVSCILWCTLVALYYYLEILFVLYVEPGNSISTLVVHNQDPFDRVKWPGFCQISGGIGLPTCKINQKAHHLTTYYITNLLSLSHFPLKIIDFFKQLTLKLFCTNKLSSNFLSGDMWPVLCTNVACNSSFDFWKIIIFLSLLLFVQKRPPEP